MSKNQEVDLKDLLSHLFKRWWLILILGIGFAGISYYVSSQWIKDVYVSTTTLFIGNEQSDINIGLSLSDLDRNSGLIEDYQEIVQTRLVIDKVMSKLNINMKIEDFMKYMEIKTLDNSRLFTVSYKSHDPVYSANVANEIASQLSEAVVEIVGVENIRVIDKALPPEEPDYPNDIISTVLGFLIGVVLAMIVNMIIFLVRDTIIKVDDIKILLNIPVLGTIPSFDRLEMAEKLIVKSKPTSYVAECFKIIRSNINYLNYDHKSKVIAFTSTLPSEGKSTTISNLALSMAKSGKKTLLIDMDLRKPKIHVNFSCSQRPGLTNVIFSEHDFNSVLHKSYEDKNLDIMTTGPLPPAPDDLIGTAKFKELIEEAKRQYDYIFLDSTPLLGMSDTTILAPLVDTIILVVGMRQAKKNEIKSAVENISQIGIKVTGVVLTKNKIRRKPYYNEYYVQ